MKSHVKIIFHPFLAIPHCLSSEFTMKRLIETGSCVCISIRTDTFEHEKVKDTIKTKLLKENFKNDAKMYYIQNDISGKWVAINIESLQSNK